MQTIPLLLSLLTILAQIIIAGMILLFILGRVSNNETVNIILGFFTSQALLLAFIVALTAVSGSLFFSEIMHLPPCKLCWYQRIFMYPQAILLGVALIFKDKTIWRHIIPLSIIGGAIALYHYYIQTYPNPSAVCSLTSPESCSEILIKYYGYITIPLMSFTASFLNLILGLLALKRGK